MLLYLNQSTRFQVKDEEGLRIRVRVRVKVIVKGREIAVAGPFSSS